MRFFVKNRFDVHNSRMATDRHQAPSYPLRMPDELKARIQAAADASGRSLHAELLHRLQNSFESREVGWDVRLARHTNEVRGEVLASHISMMQMHVNMLRDRLRLLRANDADVEEVLRTVDLIASTEAEISRMSDQRMKVLQEGFSLEEAYDDEASRIAALMDQKADAALQDQYRDIHDRHVKLEIPPKLGERVVYVVPPAEATSTSPEPKATKSKPAAKRSSKKM